MSPAFRKALKLTLKSIAGLLAILFIALLLLLWRLSSSPIQLNQLVPRIEQAASGLPGDLSVRLQGIGLFWNRAERQIDLRALDVELVESSGTSLASVPEVNISLSIFALMRGVIALSSIELHDVEVQLVRRENGTFQIFRKSNDAPVPGNDKKPRDFKENVQHIFKVLASEADTENPLSFLKRLKLKGSLQVDDRKNGLHWAAHSVDSLFVGYKGVVKADLGFDFSSPRAMEGIHTDVALNLKEDTVSASLEFAGVRPAGFAPFDKRLAALAGLDMSVSGTVKTTLTLPDKMNNLTADIKVGAGKISYQDFYPEPLKFNSLGLQLSADVPGKSLKVSGLDVLFGDAASPLKLHLTAEAQMLENAVAVKFVTDLEQLKVKDFNLYWPMGVAQGARTWLVTNLKAGSVNSAQVDLDVLVPTGPETKFQLRKLNGNLDYSDLVVDYFGSLPSATGMTGSGTFDQRGFKLDINKGLVNGVNIESGQILISGLDIKKAAISVDTHLNGQLAAVFALLEKPPISLAADFVTGPVSDHLGGQVESAFNISLPLRSGLANGDIQYQASGKITDGSFSKIYRNYDLQVANIGFSLDQSKVNFNGPLEFSGIPLTLDWTTSLDGSSKGHAEISISAPNITGKQISELGYDVSKYLQGSMSLKTTASVAPGQQVTASIETDLNNAAMAIPQIHWSKAAGDGGNIDFNLIIEKHHFHAKDINIGLGKLKTIGNAEFDMEGSVVSLSLAHLSLSYAQLKGLKLERKEGKDLQFTLQGGEGSLEPFLAGSNKVADPLEKKVLVQSEALVDKLKSTGIVFEIGESKLDRLYLNKETYFDNVRFSGRRDARGWQEVNITGHNPFADSKDDGGARPDATQRLGSEQFRFVFGPPENGRYRIHLEAEDLGSLVSAVKGRNIMSGGYLLLDGDSQGPFLTKPIQADFKLDSFTLNEAPPISSILNMASLSQVISTFRRTGLAFNQASGDLFLDGMRLSSKQLRMRGGSLGLLAKGWVDIKQHNLDMNGTVIPMSRLNSIVGLIPLLGDAVVGKDGKGIFAVDYTLTGSIEQPKTSIQRESLTENILKDTLGPDEESAIPNPQ